MGILNEALSNLASKWYKNWSSWKLSNYKHFIQVAMKHTNMFCYNISPQKNSLSQIVSVL